jgi:prepilin-type N-terminal cleavage/methylation domain-containing protein
MHSGYRGFTIIELLVAVGILGLMLAIGIPSFASIRKNVALGNDADEIVSALRLAQSSSMASQGGQNHGVLFMSDKYCLFSGSAPASCPASGTTYTLGGYGIAIVGAPITVLFQRLSGVTSAQSIVVGISGGSQKTIQLEATGKISIQ